MPRSLGRSLAVLPVVLGLALASASKGTPPGSAEPPSPPSLPAVRDLTLKGLALGSPEALVRKELGRPLAERSGEDELGCETGLDAPGGKTLLYPGLEVHLCRTTQNPEYALFQWIATDARWQTFRGLEVGSPVQKVLNKLGESGVAESRSDGTQVLTYSLGEAGIYLWFKFRKGLVVEMGMREDRS